MGQEWERNLCKAHNRNYHNFYPETSQQPFACCPEHRVTHLSFLPVSKPTMRRPGFLQPMMPSSSPIAASSS